MAVDVGSATGYLDLDISGFLNGLKSAQSEAEKTTKSMAVKMGEGFQSAGKALTSAGSTLTKGITAPVIALGTGIVKTGADFQSAMAKVRSISGASGKDFEDLNKKAREMGASTAFSASEAAQAFQYMAMAGWDTESMIGGISGVMDLAAASGEDLSTVSDIVTDAMTAFGMSAKDTSKVLKDGVETEVDNTTRFVDALAAASNSSNTNVAMLGESFKYVAPVAGSLGYSVEDTAVALGLMANQGIKASQAGTSLKTILSNMSSPTASMAMAMDTLGVSLTDEEGNMLSLMDVMKDLRKGFGEGNMSADEMKTSLADLDSQLQSGKIDSDDYAAAVENLYIATYGAEGAQKAMLAAQLAGKEGMSGLLAIVSSSDEDFDRLSESIYNAAGTSKSMAEIMQNTLLGQLKILVSAIQELALQFADVLLPIIKDAIVWLQGLIAKLQDIPVEQKKQILMWAAIAASVGPVLLALGKVVTTIGSVITAFGSISKAVSKLKSGFALLKTAIAGISAPVVAVVAIIAVLIAAFARLWATNEEFRNKITAIWDGVKKKFEEFGQGIVERLNAIGFDFENFTEVMVTAWDAFCNLLGPIFEGVLRNLSNILSSTLDIITGVLDIFIGVFTGNWGQAWSGVKEVFGGIWNGITGTFSNWAETFRGIADVFLGWFGTSWNDLWAGVKNFFTSTWESIKNFFVSIMASIQSIFTPAWNAIYAVVSSVVNGISDVVTKVFNVIHITIAAVMSTIRIVITSVWETISNAVKSVLDTISRTVRTVFDTIFNTIRTVMDTIRNTIQTVWNNILYIITLLVVAVQDIIRNIFEAIKAFLSGNVEETKNKLINVWTTIKNLITELVNAIRNTITTVFNGIKSTITTVMGAIQTTMSTVWNAIKTTVTTIVNGIKSTIETVWNGIKTVTSVVMTGVKATMATIWNSIKSTTVDIAVGLKSSLSSTFEGIKSSISSSMSSAKSNIVNAMSEAKNSAIRVWDGITSTFEEIGRNIIQGIINGIGSMVGKLYDSIYNSLSNLVDKAKDALDINSPSGVFRDQIGRWLPPGIAVGFASAMGQATKDIQKSLNKGIDSIEADTISVGITDDTASSLSMVADYYESIESRLAESVASMRSNLEYLISAGAAAANGVSLGYVGVSGITSGGNAESNQSGDLQQGTREGNTYVFYTSKSIDEIEAAKQMRRTERDMAEGF